MAVNHVLVAGGDLDGDDVPGDARGEGDGAGGSVRSVFGHEESSAAGDSFESSQEATSATVLGVGSHLNGLAHPRQFTGLRDDGVVVVERELEDGHGGSDDAMLHAVLLADDGKYNVDPTPAKSAQGIRFSWFSLVPAFCFRVVKL